MIKVEIDNTVLKDAGAKGADALLETVTSAVKTAIDGELNADTMAQLSTSQLTLLAYDILREEVMDGGFIQLIHNGYGGFMFLNPVAKVMKTWGLRELAQLLFDGRRLYFKHREEIERDCSDEEFMALFERFAEFDELDDEFVEHEEEWSSALAYYIDDHIGDFVVVK